MITGEREDVPADVRPAYAGTYRASVISFALSAIAVGLLLGTGPISIFPAMLGVVSGLYSSYRLRASPPGRGGRGMATAAVVIGLIAGAISLIMIFGS